jgi:hypothetical protein
MEVQEMFDIATIRAALGDPGRLYNIGNALVLVGGVGGAIAAAIGDGFSLGAAAERVANHFWGSPSAIALSLAIVVFFAGGTAYSRAWKGNGPKPDPLLTRRGDLLSGIGAVVLGAGLAMLGDAVLAVFAGVLHASGKFGSALATGKALRTSAGPVPIDDLCKDIVLISRVPALFAALSGLVSATLNSGEFGTILLAATVVVSTIYWALADILLLRRNGLLMTNLHRIAGRLGGHSRAE